MRMDFIKVLELSRSMTTYNQLKNYDTFFDMEIYQKDPDHPQIKNSLPYAKDKPLKWSEWEIQSAMEYDLMFVPKLGDEGWNRMLGRPGHMASNRV